MQLTIRLLTAFFFLSLSQLMAQSRHERIGDELYSRLAYAKAIPHYKTALKKSPENASLTYRLAHCYYLVRDYEASEKWFAKLVQMEDIPPESYFEYGHVLLQQKRYDDAQAAFSRHEELHPEDDRSRQFSKSLADRGKWYRDSAAFTVEPLPINSPESDFGAVRFLDGVVFASSRPVGTPTDLIYEGLNAHFLNLYYAEEKAKRSNQWENPDLLKGDIRTKFHESSFTIDTSGTRAFFSRNNFLDGKKGKNDEKTILLKIYQVEMDGRKGKNITEFPYNNDSYSITHPSLSADGRHLHFASDMPGGQGGKDIYVSHFENGAWTEPENLGPVVNTSGNEVFPFLADDGMLYFASDGHPGIGNLDIFQTRPQSANPQVRNVGAPINSEFDDFAIYWDRGKGSGFFSSNRSGGKGDDDIYRFQIELPSLEIQVKDSVSQFPIENAEVVLSDTSGSVIAVTRTDSTGHSVFTIARDNIYRVKVNSVSFEPYLITVNTETEVLVSEYRYDVTLYNPPPAITALVVDEGNKIALADAEITLRKTDVPDSVFRRTDRYGRFSVKLDPNSSYEMMVRKEGYFAFKSAFSTTRNSFDGDTIIPLRMMPVEIDKIMVLRNIHYDFDKWDLRPEAMEELEKLAVFLNDNPLISIELGAHTDSRGSDTYNQKLSERRAVAARGHLLLLGIDEKRISFVGYGESRPVNECKNGVQCSEREHFANRRTEFKITGYEGKIIQKSGLPEE